MYEHAIVETLSRTFNAISVGNIYDVMLHVKAATLRGLTSIFVYYIMQFQKIIVYKIPPEREGVYSQLKAYSGSSAATKYDVNLHLFFTEQTTLVLKTVCEVLGQNLHI